MSDWPKSIRDLRSDLVRSGINVRDVELVVEILVSRHGGSWLYVPECYHQSIAQRNSDIKHQVIRSGLPKRDVARRHNLSIRTVERIIKSS